MDMIAQLDYKLVDHYLKSVFGDQLFISCFFVETVTKRVNTDNLLFPRNAPKWKNKYIYYLYMYMLFYIYSYIYLISI